MSGRRVPHPGVAHVEFPYVYLDATYVQARDHTSAGRLDGRRDRHRRDRER